MAMAGSGSKDGGGPMGKVQELCTRYREQILYLVFGFLAFLVSMATFALADRVLMMPTLIANVFSWVITVAFAYWTNRTWVFESKATGFKPIVREILSFATGRLLTLAIEELMLFVGVTLLAFDSILVKLVAQVVVIVLNYVISKFVVFKKEG